MKKEKIIINGDLGAGKTVIGKKLAEYLGYTFISTGDFFRKEAEERNISLKDLNILMETDIELELSIDRRIMRFMQDNEKYVADSRMGVRFEPNAYSVYLTVEELVGAQRIWDDIQKNPKRLSESNVRCLEDVLINNRQRSSSEKFRYNKLYRFDPTDLSQYSYFRDTSTLPWQQIANELQIVYRLWLKD